MIQIKRAYLPAEPADGARFLVDRLWPRGIKKEDLPLQEWLKDVAPSNELRHWFHHDPERWPEFRTRYRAELAEHPETWQPLLELARHHTVTLVYAGKDPLHNNALVLQEFLEHKISPRKS
ncbi:DUF488 domain-containing protein [Silvibacterium dinghuense]|uniref:DUF488 domain-containing protein n=1 Tax=Silvibacterium dinghuense TaxID=1560006 RepID=A0A4Q1SB15_9BACT|nr:DUF488 domain-containing protein [Silvibacterium dinghuense]RXS93872.1 DUF488 domain-containing protein [Silvibacterium dinghuense]GGH08378.1 hypothetical protein GCM10011586_25910 [Silvibacterium dinghuense]